MQQSIPLVVFFLLAVGVSTTAGSNDTDTIIDAIARIATIAGANKTEVNSTAATVKKVVNVVEKVITKLATEKTLKQLQKVTSVLAMAGPPMIAVAMFLSVIGVFTGSADSESPELIAIKKGFENIDRRLNTIDNTLQELKHLIQMSSAQVGYLDICNTIDNIHTEWTSFADSKNPTAMEKEEFLLAYNKYNYAALNLWRGMVPSGGNALAFDLLEVYRAQVNCNPMKLQMFCANIVGYINKGLVIEGAYHGMKNLTEKARRLANEWEERMKQLVARCDSISEKCEADWEPIATGVAQKVLDKFGNADNAKLADNLFKELSDTVPQRKWAVWVYNDATGFNEHTVNSAFAIRLWDKNGKDVTVIGHEEENPLPDFGVIQPVFDDVSYDTMTNRQCLVGGNTRYYKNEARGVVDGMMEGLKKKEGGVYVYRTFYVVQSNKNIAFRANQGRFFQKPMKGVCLYYEMQLFVVQ